MINLVTPTPYRIFNRAVMTITEFDEAVCLDTGDVTAGGMNVYPSFIKPWSLHEFKHGAIHR